MTKVFLVLVIALSALDAAAQKSCQQPAPPTLERLPAAGPLYRVTEPDWAQLLARRLREAQSSGELAMAEQKSRAFLSAWRHHPVSAGTLARARETTFERYSSDPRFKNASFQQSAIGRALLNVRRQLLFIDADDPVQVRHAGRVNEASRGEVRITLLAGDVEALEKHLGARIYFDQGATLKRRFHLKTLPSLVTVSLESITVQSYPLTDNGRRVRVTQAHSAKGHAR